MIGGLLIATVLLGLRFRRGDGGQRELLDGLTVLAERDGNDERAGRAYAAYMKLLGL